MEILECLGQCRGWWGETQKGLSFVKLLEGEDVGCYASWVVEYMVPIVNIVFPKGGASVEDIVGGG